MGIPESEKSFIDLVNKHRALIFKVCHLYCGDSENRRDLFQEIVLQLWKSFTRFRNESAVSTWIYRISLNTAISNFRKEVKMPARASLSLAELHIPDVNDTEDQENHLVLHTAIATLSDIEKAIIMLYLEEKNYEEMSSILGISTSNVGARINRIKNKLTQRIKNDNT